METSDKIAMVHKYVEAFDKADLDIIREIYSTDGFGCQTTLSGV